MGCHATVELRLEALERRLTQLAKLVESEDPASALGVRDIPESNHTSVAGRCLAIEQDETLDTGKCLSVGQ